jgi:branched-chain amino acid transport system ATP-binding protein
VIRFGGVTALDGATMGVDEGEVCGLIGPNGAGKTTLFNCVSRLYTPQSGTIRFQGDDLLRRRPHEIAGLGIARTFQNLALVHGLSVRDNVLLGAHHRARAGLVGAALALSPGCGRRNAPCVRRPTRSSSGSASRRWPIGPRRGSPTAR